MSLSRAQCAPTKRGSPSHQSTRTPAINPQAPVMSNVRAHEHYTVDGFFVGQFGGLGYGLLRRVVDPLSRKSFASRNRDRFRHWTSIRFPGVARFAGLGLPRTLRAPVHSTGAFAFPAACCHRRHYLPWLQGSAMSSNPATDPVPFGHWTLRDAAAQRRSSPR